MSDSSSSEIEEIWGVFGEESRENLDQVESCLLTLETDPKNASEIGALFRAMHTIKGSARMMGLNSLETLGHRAEDLVSQVRDQKLDIDDTLVSILLAVSDCLRRMLDQAVLHRSDLSDDAVSGLIEQLNTVISDGPAALAGKILRIEALSKIEAVADLAERFAPPDDPEDEIERIDLAMDPASVRIFFEMADDEFRHIISSLDVLSRGETEGIERMINSADSLQYAAGQMGFLSLASILLELVQTLQRSERGDPEGCVSLVNSLTTELENLRRAYPFLPLKTEMPILEQAVTDPSALHPVIRPEEAAPLENIYEWKAQPEPGQGMERVPEYSGMIEESLNAITDIMGDQAILNRMITRMEQADLLTAFTNLVRKHAENTEALRKEFEPLLVKLQEQTAMISRTEKKIAASTNQLHETARSFYLKPLAVVLDPLHSFVQTQAHCGGKCVQAKIEGGDIELDPTLLAILDSCLRLLIEMIVTQRIETPDEREQAGKPKQAQLSIHVFAQGGNLQVTLQDDGSGINESSIIQKIQAYLHQKQGLFIDQSSDRGGSFRLSLPLHQSVIDGMVVRIGSSFYMVAIDTIQRILREDQTDLCHSSADEKQTFLRLGDEMIPIYYFSRMSQDIAIPILIIIESAARLFALRVDEIIGQQRASILPLPQNMQGLRHAVGCVILGEGEIGVALDVNSFEAASDLY
jgi:two-component system, chemotaxis family, sensor kinase CheA